MKNASALLLCLLLTGVIHASLTGRTVSINRATRNQLKAFQPACDKQIKCVHPEEKKQKEKEKQKKN
jgi:hypothetical protein